MRDMFCLLWQKKNKISKKYYINSKISKIVPTMWEEHCLECSPPECYSSCKIYKKRRDGACVRIDGGFVKTDKYDGTYGYAVKVCFRMWAKIEILFRSNAISIKRNYRVEKIIQILDKLFWLTHYFEFFTEKWFLFRKWELFRQKVLNFLSRNGEKANALVMDIVNEGKSCEIIVEVKSVNLVLFRQNFLICYGQNEIIIPIDCNKYERIDSRKYISIYPREVQKKCCLYFRTLELAKVDFMEEKLADNRKEKIIKCVVWDLDNTLWDGIFVDEGENVVLNKKVISYIKLLEEKGIVSSICSKNDFDEVWNHIKKLGVSDLFILPQINWEPKSRNINRIAEKMNIGVDSIVFFDDSEYERNEVYENTCGVICYDIKDIEKVIHTKPFNPPVSEESKLRKQMYIEKIKRDEVLEKSNDILSFLKDSNLLMSIKKGTLDNIERYYELFQRTNQLNLSVRRLSLMDITDYIRDCKYDFIEISLKDRYGDYGIIGVANINRETCVVEDLLFSCRAAMKKVEENFALWLLQKYGKNKNEIKIELTTTNKNKPLVEKLRNIGITIIDGYLMINESKVQKNNVGFFIEIEDLTR